MPSRSIHEQLYMHHPTFGTKMASRWHFLLIRLALLGVCGGALVIAPSAGVPSQTRFREGRSKLSAGAAGSGQQQSDRSDVVDLTMDFKRKGPTTTLRELSEAADTYGIDKQDVYGGSAPWLTEFETEVASTLGKEAALFCPSGVMAQLIALKIHATTAAKTGEARVPPPDKGGAAGTGEGGLEGVKPRGSFLCHPSSHILLHEEGAHEELLGFKAVSVGDIERPPGFDDLCEALREGNGPQPSSFVFELPCRELGGACTSAEDVKRMSRLLKERGIASHCDGARLWEAQPFYGESFAELCSSFDSVYVSFYKGLGGMTGAMLVGSGPFVAEARVWLRRFGGNVYTSLPYAVSCLHAFRSQIGTFPDRWSKLRRVTSLIGALEGASIGGEGGASNSDAPSSSTPRVRFQPPEPQCSMVHCYIRGSQIALERARDDVLAETGVKVFNRLRGVDGEGFNGRPGECYFEWNLGPANGSVEDSVFVAAWEAFLCKVGQNAES